MKNYTLSVIKEEAKAYENAALAGGEGSAGYGHVEDFAWEQIDAFPVSKIEDNQSWPDWLNDEIKWLTKDGRGEYIQEMITWWNATPDEHVILVEGTDGKFYVWDGCHRTAISKMYQHKTIPAFVGTRRAL